MLIQETPPKKYKWQKRNKNNKHNFTKHVAEVWGGGSTWCFPQGAGQNLRLRCWTTSDKRITRL